MSTQRTRTAAAEARAAIIEANLGAWPITTAQMDRAAGALGVRIVQSTLASSAASLSPARAILVPPLSNETAYLVRCVHEISELLASRTLTDRAQAHTAADHVTHDYRAWLTAVQQIPASIESIPSIESISTPPAPITYERDEYCDPDPDLQSCPSC